MSNSGNTLSDLLTLHRNNLCLQVFSLLVDLTVEDASGVRLFMVRNSTL